MSGGDLGPLERYRRLLGERGWRAFAEACRRPLPACAWANPARIAGAELGRRLAALGLEPEPLGWCPAAFRLRAGTAAGNTVEFGAGLCHLQEEASLVPATLLDPRPGERVLDLCAAPGGKAARIAAALGGRGTLVANDRSRPRTGPLRRTLARLGFANAAVTAWDAASFPRAAGRFDRVLADVPCSCEGTSRKSPEVLGRGGDRARLARLQRAILAAAARLCRPGGRIVYATCTYAPEENEAVVDAALAAAGGRLAVVPARLPGLAAAPGLTSWEGACYHPTLEGTLRLWPHQAGTGGFFVAVLEKLGDDGGSGEAGEPAGALPPGWREEEPDPWLAPLAERYGIAAEAFAGLRLVRRGRKRLSVVPADLAPPAAPEAVALGLPLLRADARRPKLATAAAMAFGGRAVRNAVEAADADAAAYLARRPFAAGAAAAAACTGPGEVLVRCRGAVLGVGVLRDEPGGGPGGGTVESLYPKGWRIELGRLLVPGGQPSASAAGIRRRAGGATAATMPAEGGGGRR